MKPESGSLDLGLNPLALRSMLSRTGLQCLGVHAQHCEQCLAAGIGQEDAKGESGKYGTGET